MSVKQGRPPGSGSRSVMVAGNFHVGLEVLCRWSDGLFYLGKIIKIEEKLSKCLVKFEDNSEYYVLFKDIQRGAVKGDIACCLCRDEKSDIPNEIVLCDNCSLGYHQQCHNPPIDSSVLKPGVEFMCRLCVFATTVKRGGALKKGPTAKTYEAMKQNLPYNLSKLTWDAQHKTNTQQCYCYCGGPGDWYQKMLQCCRCRQWFHEACIQCLELPLLCGDRFYMFVCSHCNHGPEYIKRLDMKWVDMVHLALFNLTIQGTTKYYDLIETVVPWMCDRWNDLQLDKLNCSSPKDVEKNALESLQSHKSRFCWGREIKKKISLWGLRLRAPPPAPTVILPTDGQITDEVMGTLQMKGRKTKTFVPIECSSPVPLKYRRREMAMDDSIVFRRKRAKRLLLDTHKSLKSGDSPNQEYRGYNGCRKRSFGRRSVSCNSDGHDSGFETASHCTLDSIIPPPIDFEGHNHPFKTVVEQNEEIAKRQRLRERLLNLSRMNSDYDNSSQCSLDSSQFSVDEESVDMISEDFEEEEQSDSLPKKRSRRKNRKYDAMLDGYSNKRAKIWGLPHPVKNVVDPRAIHAVSAQEVNFQNLKSSVKDYFGAADRLAQGEKFRVIARRVTPESKVQYLVEWEGVV